MWWMGGVIEVMIDYAGRTLKEVMLRRFREIGREALDPIHSIL